MSNTLLGHYHVIQNGIPICVECGEHLPDSTLGATVRPIGMSIKDDKHISQADHDRIVATLQKRIEKLEAALTKTIDAWEGQKPNRPRASISFMMSLKNAREALKGESIITHVAVEGHEGLIELKEPVKIAEGSAPVGKIVVEKEEDEKES